MCGYVTYTNRAKRNCLVGTVFMGCYCAGKTTVREFHFEGDRKSIRDQAVEQALTFICDRLRKYDR